jgi:hypothetical protein
MAAHFQVVAQYSNPSEQLSSFMTGLVRIGEIEVSSVIDMVNKIVAKLQNGNQRIALLEIYAHGSPKYISLGDTDVIHDFTPRQHMPTLMRLRRHFTSEGAVVLYVCQVGQARNLLLEIAKTIGVPVFASTGDILPNMPLPFFNHGNYVVARPDGTFDANGVSVPQCVIGDAAAVIPKRDPSGLPILPYGP